MNDANFVVDGLLEPAFSVMLSIARDKPIDIDVREQLAMIQSATVLAACAHMAMTRLVVPALKAAQRPHLTPRERDCLGYVMLGKSTSVISDLLNISRPTVDFHLKNVMRKMGVATRLQAIAMAAHLDLLE
jgi:DNA-binding CsgD family transcriptional regulator